MFPRWIERAMRWPRQLPALLAPVHTRCETKVFKEMARLRSRRTHVLHAKQHTLLQSRIFAPFGAFRKSRHCPRIKSGEVEVGRV